MKEYKCADCGAPMNEGEARTFTKCDNCWDKFYEANKPKDKPPSAEVVKKVLELNAKFYDDVKRKILPIKEDISLKENKVKYIITNWGK